MYIAYIYSGDCAEKDHFNCIIYSLLKWNFPFHEDALSIKPGSPPIQTFKNIFLRVRLQAGSISFSNPYAFGEGRGSRIRSSNNSPRVGGSECRHYEG